MTLLRDVITIPERVTASDFVMRLSEGVDNAGETLKAYVVTPDLERNFGTALGLVGQALSSGKSQAAFLHGSFGSGKSHFMAVLHELISGNRETRGMPDLAKVIDDADKFLSGRKVLQLNFHLIGSTSVEAAIFEGYLQQVRRRHADAPPAALHRSEALLSDAGRQRKLLGDEQFFAVLSGDGASAEQEPSSSGWGSFAAGWDAVSYQAAASASPDDPDRQRLVVDLTRTMFSGYTHSAEYVDLDTGLAVLSQHAKTLGYDAVVLYLDELILWLASHLADHEFVSNEGAKLAKLVEAADAHRPVPLISFVARQRDLTEFLGSHVPGAQRQAFSDVFSWSRGRFEEIKLEDRNLPLIAEKRLLQPKNDAGRQLIDAAFNRVKSRTDIWDVLLQGAQNDDAGIGSDQRVFRQVYPFTPALVSSLVALSQALQRERTALKVMLQLLVDQRDELAVEDLVPVGDLFDVLVGGSELPDEPALRRHFETARTLYRTKLRPVLLASHKLDESGVVGLGRTHQFRVDDRLIKTLLLSALLPDVPALHHLTAGKLAALNHGTISTPLRGEEKTIVHDKITKLAATVGEIRVGEGDDPQISMELAGVDYESVLDNARGADDVGQRKALLRELVWGSLGVKVGDQLLVEQAHPVVWRGRKHVVDLVFGNVRSTAELPDSALQAVGGHWKVVVDFPFDDEGNSRRDDVARIEALNNAGFESRTVCWIPAFFSQERLEDLGTLVVLNHVLAGEGGRLQTYGSSLSPQDRAQAKVMLEQRQRMLRARLLDCMKQAYGAAKAQPSDIDGADAMANPFECLASGFAPAAPVGADLATAFGSLADQMFEFTYPGKPNFTAAEAEVRATDLRKVLSYIERAVADPARRVIVDSADRPVMRRICNSLRLGEIAEDIYVLDDATGFWKRHFLQEASKRKVRDHFSVQMLRELTDQPADRGFDRLVQNLLISALALDHDLAWFQRNGAIASPALEMVSDDLELRHPRLPDESSWEVAAKRAAGLFGAQPASLRSASTVARLSAQVRHEAATAGRPAQQLLGKLTEHAVLLGLDPDATTGRLATARATADLLARLGRESDDVALVELLYSTEMPTTDVAAAKSFRSAQQVADGLAHAQWNLLETIRGIQDSRAEEARAITDQLAEVARLDEFEAPLIIELNDAVRRAGQLLAEPAPLPPPPLPPPSGDNEMTAETQEDIATAADRIRQTLEANPTRSVRITWRVTE